MSISKVIVTTMVAMLPITAPAQAVRPLHSLAPGATRATLRTAKQPQKFRPIKLGPHTFYGTITSVNGTNITIRTRRQRIVNVDATTVLADGTYSAPLFVGKLVTVDGDQAANGIFTAAHISRMTNLNALPNDH